MIHIHQILVAGRLLEHSHASTGMIPLASFRIFMAEIEQLVRDSATELDRNADRLADDRNEHGYPIGLSTL